MDEECETMTASQKNREVAKEILYRFEKERDENLASSEQVFLINSITKALTQVEDEALERAALLMEKRCYCTDVNHQSPLICPVGWSNAQAIRSLKSERREGGL